MERFATPLLAFVAGCFLDTAPIVTQELGSTSPVIGSAGTAGSEPPPAAVAGSGGRDAAVASPADAGAVDAGAPIISQPLQPSASNGIPDAGTAPPPTTTPNQTTDAGTIPPAAVKQCNAVGSYALRAVIDVTWEATTWSDVGQGSVELFALLDVETVDSQASTANASFRVCGLALPTLNSSALCSSYQLQVPESIWAESSLPEEQLDGTYECDASQCTLRLAPASYLLGIRLPDPHGPWPEVKDTSPAQFADDDVDGLPGVTVDVVSVASLPTGPMGCTASNGPGQTGPINTNSPGGPGNPTTTPVMPTELGNMLVGLRAQLTAAMKLAPDCQLNEVTASDAALDMRSAGCFVADGTDPASASAVCSEELRASYDDTIVQYEALKKGETPKHGGPGKKQESAGPILQAVRFAPGTKLSCEQVRSTKF